MATIKVFDRGVMVGDAAFKDSTTGRVCFLRYSELDSIPSTYTFIGVVFNVNRGVAKILHKEAQSLKYALDTYSDGMQASTSYLRKNGGTTNYRGIMNIARGVAYWGTNGSTPTSNIPIQYSGNDIISKSAFETSQYCKLLRQTYASYESYIKNNIMVMVPQHYGCFNLPDSKTLQTTYGDLTDGSNYKYPAFHYCKHINYSSDGIAEGDWFLPNVWDGAELMRDDVLTKVAATMTKMSGSVPNNSTNRWFAQRCSSSSAWVFSGGSGVLNNATVTSAFTVQAVALLAVP